MKPGEAAPTFELPSDDGTTIRLSDELAQGPVVLFFYPKAMTPGCTKESCHFRDLAAEFAEVKAPPHRHQRRHRRQAAQVQREARVRLPAAVRQRPHGGQGLRREARPCRCSPTSA